jgi:hypothetical protein
MMSVVKLTRVSRSAMCGLATTQLACPGSIGSTRIQGWMNPEGLLQIRLIIHPHDG